MKMVFRVAIVVAVACTLTVAVAATKLHPLSDEFIDLINSKQTIWKAGKNFPTNTPMTHIKRLAGAYSSFNKDCQPKTPNKKTLASLPDSFDPREKWPSCSSLAEIRDQGSCGSDWAVAAVSAMTDRICIQSNGTTNFHVSAEDVLSCCFLGNNRAGCLGGDPKNAWIYWNKQGIVSGGNYNSNEGCRPYSLPICEHHEPDNSVDSDIIPLCFEDDYVKKPNCFKTCRDGYGVTYKKDKLHGQAAVCPNNPGEEYVMAELLTNGPVEAVFDAYVDFYHYKHGVYRYTEGQFVRSHAVKLLGWGVENGTKYWLAANSWNTYWGDNGFFKFLRGENHLGIESNIVFGNPQF